MANIEFNIFSQKEPINLNVRFYHNKIDVNTKTNIFVFIKDIRFKRISKGKKSSKSVEIVNPTIKEKTEKLKRAIFEQFAEDFPKGNRIDSNWLIKILNEFHDKPEGEDDPKYFFVPFFESHIEYLKTKINPKTGKFLDPKTITRYKYTLGKLKEFEEYENVKLRTVEIDLNFHSEFLYYYKEICTAYANTTIDKWLSHIRFFAREAEAKDYKINPESQSDKFTIKKDETLETYLNEEEIEKIYNLDLSENQTLHDVRDLFIAGLRTGLRISDLKRINTFEVSEGRIKITEIEKTDRHIIIPLHPQLKSIIEQREGTLPEFSEQRFNEKVKDLCKLAEINEVILGSVKNAETKRKEKGYYPKWKLIASHTCRRSFVTNLYGKLDDITIMAITGHKKHSQFLDYVKTTNEEHIQKLEEHWKKNNSHE